MTPCSLNIDQEEVRRLRDAIYLADFRFTLLDPQQIILDVLDDWLAGNGPVLAQQVLDEFPAARGFQDVVTGLKDADPERLQDAINSAISDMEELIDEMEKAEQRACSLLA